MDPTLNPDITTQKADFKAEMQYLNDFHFIVIGGLSCGLEHPTEWALNAWRTPAATLQPEYYEHMRYSIPRFLCDVFGASFLRDPTEADMKEWVAKHYATNMLMRDTLVHYFSQWVWPADPQASQKEGSEEQ